MNSDDLALFSQVVKSASISRAAMALGADQSTISRRIGLLEADLGVRLFHRSGRGVTLTDRGQQLLGYATKLNDTLAEAERVMRESVEHGPVKLCIAAQPTIARILFGRLGHALKARFPLTQLHFVEALAADILNRLSEGTVDMALIYLPEHPGALQFDPLVKEGIQLITPGDYPLNGDAIAVRDLGDIPLILPSTHHGLRLLVESLAGRHGFTTNIALECDGSISITKRLVLENCGCTVLPEAAVIEEIKSGRLKSYRIEEPEVSRTVAIVWPKNRTTVDGLWEVTQIVREHAAAMVDQGLWPGATLVPAPVNP
ncbi:DNA-binding transcriptional LysR family regulator [Pseudomonas sp. JUb42]|jgi:DNA-binding transcriptional LysR family regulator|uniref:LysR family transcriptional regulator n=1 Tax=Pseudomonas sp. JUb42 TaxID=2940611 RepID=UPI0021689EBE|nr:LysR family transcriptional regulator [Pseudomonas sp. JUb42]MCS3471462.1 DNA-binding transcriptional LysR family regulator [Pseudomonas sp. JUb42]